MRVCPRDSWFSKLAGLAAGLGKTRMAYIVVEVLQMFLLVSSFIAALWFRSPVFYLTYIPIWQFRPSSPPRPIDYDMGSASRIQLDRQW